MFIVNINWDSLDFKQENIQKAEEFYERYKQDPDKYVFLDVRNQEAYNRLHAEGTKLMPLHTFYTERLFLPKNTDQTIVLICSGGVASGVAYHYLEHHGFFQH